MANRSAGGSVALHGIHRVDDGQYRSNRLGKVDQHRAEVAGILKAVVHLRLLQTGDAAEQIFDPAGKSGHAVGFELADRQNQICLHHRMDEVKFAADAGVFGSDRLVADIKIEHSAALFGSLLHPAGLVDTAQGNRGVQSTRGIGDDDLRCLCPVQPVCQ